MSYGITRVIGNWKPRKFTKEHISKQFPLVLKRLLGSYKGSYISVRVPSIEREHTQAVDQFHQDGVTDCYFAVWSNVHPTEVKFKNGSRLVAKEGDIILINNLEVEHRRPIVTKPRWFARMFEIVPGKYSGKFDISA